MNIYVAATEKKFEKQEPVRERSEHRMQKSLFSAEQKQQQLMSKLSHSLPSQLNTIYDSGDKPVE